MISKRPVLLFIDAGNTRVKWACIAVDVKFQLPVPWETFDSCSHQELQLLSQSISRYAVLRCLVSNVAGEHLQIALEQLLHAACQDLQIECFRSSANCAGITSLYREVEKLGSDRFASAIAAHRVFPKQAIVMATCGTATTVDAITADGTFLGGMILPGLQLMASSLAKNTAQLPEITAQAAMSGLFADHTNQAIASGCIHAQLGAILCAVSELQNHPKNAGKLPVQLVLSGGAAPYLIPQLQRWQQVTPSLQLHWHHLENTVLTGLWIVAQASNVSTS